MTVGRRLGVDVGGTKCLGVILDNNGEVIDEQRRPTPKGPDAIIATLAELARAMGPWDSIGIGVPGLVTRTGVLRAAPNLVDINNFEVGALLTAELGTTVYVDNDGTCAAAAEWKTIRVGTNTKMSWIWDFRLLVAENIQWRFAYWWRRTSSRNA